MLIKEKMEKTRFSPAESVTVTYLLENADVIEKMSIQDLAKETFTQASSIVRIAKKLGFKGWVDFKKAYLEEYRYLTSQFTQVDSNIPFTEKDNVMAVATKITALEKSTIDDLLSLLRYDDLSKAKQLLSSATIIYIFGQNANIILAQDFAMKMRRIGRAVHIVNLAGEERYEAFNIPSDALAILISTSGETALLLEIHEIVKQRGVKTIGMTSIGNNTLSRQVDLFLPITTRERLYSKIGNFTSNMSIHVLLDILYSLVFSSRYQENLDHLMASGRQIDLRKSATILMDENKI